MVTWQRVHCCVPVRCAVLRCVLRRAIGGSDYKPVDCGDATINKKSCMSRGCGWYQGYSGPWCHQPTNVRSVAATHVLATCPSRVVCACACRTQRTLLATRLAVAACATCWGTAMTAAGTPSRRRSAWTVGASGTRSPTSRTAALCRSEVQSSARGAWSFSPLRGAHPGVTVLLAVCAWLALRCVHTHLYSP